MIINNKQTIMFSKSIIYLLFPTIFSSISVETDFEKEREIKTEKVSTQQFVENGIEKVTVALKAISIEEITTFITNLDTQKEIKEQKTVQHSSKSLKNNCEDSTEQKLCLN